MNDALVSLVTSMADDELVLGHRHSEWTGWAPHIEEDVAFSSIAQDEIGHASNYFALITSITGDDVDRLALGRPKGEYRHAVICERPNRDWAYTLARHWLYETADDVRLDALQDSANEELRALVAKMRREERYHHMHANSWLRRVSHGPVEARTKLVHALAEVFPESMGLFEPVELEDEAVKEGWLPVPFTELRERFRARAIRALDELGLPTEEHAEATETAEFVASSSGDLIAAEGEPGPEARSPTGFGGRRGEHTEDFDALWDDMTYTYRNHPGATW